MHAKNKKNKKMNIEYNNFCFEILKFFYIICYQEGIFKTAYKDWKQVPANIPAPKTLYLEMLLTSGKNLNGPF